MVFTEKGLYPFTCEVGQEVCGKGGGDKSKEVFGVSPVGKGGEGLDSILIGFSEYGGEVIMLIES